MDWTYPNIEAFDIAVFRHNGGDAYSYCLMWEVLSKLERRGLWRRFVDEYKRRKFRTSPGGDFYAPDVERIIWTMLPKT